MAVFGSEGAAGAGGATLRWGGWAALVAAGVAANCWPYPVFFSVDFLFGGVFAWLAFQVFGFRSGVVAAFLISAVTWKLWNHPYGVVVTTCELGFVGWASTRKNLGVVLCDAFYWLLAGIPLVALFYGGVMGLPVENVAIMMGKQAVNGIANALSARLLFMWGARNAPSRLFPLREVVFNLLVLFLLWPSLLLLGFQGRADYDASDGAIRNSLSLTSRRVAVNLERWLSSRVSEVSHFAQLAADRAPAEMQRSFDDARGAGKNFLSLSLVGEGDAVVVRSPRLDEGGRTLRGRRLSDEPYLPALRQGLGPAFSAVFPLPGGSRRPAAALVVPVVSGGRPRGGVAGILDLRAVEELLALNAAAQALPGLFFTLIDQERKVLVTNRPDAPPLTPLPRWEGTEIPLSGGIFERLPSNRKNVSVSDRWRHSFYLTERHVGGLAEWNLVLEQPMAPFQRALYRSYAAKLGLLLVVVLAAVGAAELVSRRVLGSLESLGQLSARLPLRLAPGEHVAWSSGGILEAEQFFENFRKASDALDQRFTEIQQLNASLELRVQERTQELLASEEKYRVLFENELSAIAIFDLTTLELLDVNGAFERLYGYGREELLGGMTVRDVSAEVDESERAAGVAAGEGRLVVPMRWHRKKDGTLFPVEIVGGRYTWRGRGVMFAMMFDITERREAEEEARQLSDQMESILRVIPVGLAYVKDRTLQWTNPGFDQMFGYEPRAAWGHPTVELYADPATWERVGREGYDRLAAGEAYSLDTPLKRVDGSPFWCRLVGRQLEGGGSLGSSIWTMEDVTERLHAERQLRRSETQLRAITHSAQEAIVMIDSGGRVTFWNPAAERLLGYTAAEALGQDLHGLIAPLRYREAGLAGVEAFRNTGTGAFVGRIRDLEARRKDGEEISVERSLSAIQLDGEWHAVGLLRDVTERKRAEAALWETNQKLAEAIERAETANVAKSEFLANMSHEIRTPMNGVIGMTGLLLDTNLDDDQRRCAEVVRTSGEALLSLINDILDLSKIEARKLDLEVLDFDLSDLLDDFAPVMALRAREKELELICAADPEVPGFLQGDPGRLRQILTNLVGNALKFTRSGEVAVRVSLVEEREDDVLLRFSVRDTGIGIPPDKLGMLFEKFNQLDASTTRQYGGTGLGLAISKQLAELLGGEIGVESQEGRGSEFWFTARLGKQPGGGRAGAPAPADLNGVRVLVIDDNVTNREILTRRLTFWGMRPSEAADAPGALQVLYEALLADRDPYRVALIDMQMPGMDGEALGRVISTDEQLAGTRMVLLTSQGARGDARRFQEIGFSAYATKPVNPQELKTLLSLALAEPEGIRSASLPIATRHVARETRNLFAGRRGRVLLAEDNVTNQQVALGILKKLGLNADAVANGAEAVEALRSVSYDLVLMDVQMPEMDGFEAARRIRDPRFSLPNPTIPVVAMTANAMQGDRQRCLDAGMDDYVPKPVTPQALAAVLEKWLPRDAGALPAPPVQAPAQPPSAGGAGPLVFDRAGMLDRLMDDEVLAKKILDGFLADTPPRLQALRECLDAGDAAGVGHHAHTVKGSAGTVGGEVVVEVAYAIEKAGREGDLAAARARLPDLEHQYERLTEAIARER